MNKLVEKYYDENGFYFVFIDDVNDDRFIMFLLGATVPIPIEGRKRAYWHDYQEFKQK